MKRLILFIALLFSCSAFAQQQVITTKTLKITGSIEMQGKPINNLPAPVLPHNPVTLEYFNANKGGGDETTKIVTLQVPTDNTPATFYLKRGWAIRHLNILHGNADDNGIIKTRYLDSTEMWGVTVDLQISNNTIDERIPIFLFADNVPCRVDNIDVDIQDNIYKADSVMYNFRINTFLYGDNPISIELQLDKIAERYNIGSVAQHVSCKKTVLVAMHDAGVTAHWYDVAVAGTQLAEGDTFTIENLSADKIYYCELRENTKILGRIKVIVKENVMNPCAQEFLK